MKINHKMLIPVLGAVMMYNGVACAVPSANDCANAYPENEYALQYEISSATMTNGEVLYVCNTAKCVNGYVIGGSGSGYRSWHGYYFLLTNTCMKDPNSGGSSSKPDCSTGVLCTMCKGPSVTINGQIYCGMWASDKTTRTCTTPPGANVAYQMSKCCNADGYAVGTANGCYVLSCKTGMVQSDAKNSCVCDVGYYGAPSAGCSRCPSIGGLYGVTDGRGKTKITECCIPNGLKVTDAYGTYEYADRDCCYTE